MTSLADVNVMMVKINRKEMSTMEAAAVAAETSANNGRDISNVEPRGSIVNSVEIAETPYETDPQNQTLKLDRTESKRQVRFSLRETPNTIQQGQTETAQQDVIDNQQQQIQPQQNHHEVPVDEHRLKKDEEVKHHKETLAFYTKPVQRQRWGDVQLRPHTNWGDIFFDLFYVAAAYNLGNLIRAETSWRGLLYFIGCYEPVQLLWFNKLRYDSRFFTRDDIWHQAYEVAGLLVLATVVLHIRPVSILSHPSEHVDMFAFALALSLAQLIVIGRHVEILFGVEGEKAAKGSALADIRHEGIALVFYVIATIVAGVKFYGNSDHEASSDYIATTDVPIWLCFAGTVASSLWLSLVVLVFMPKGGGHKKVTVPMNIDYSIHRYGGWVMLMLGEGVLSLLIVDISNVPGYYVTFFSGVVSLTLMEYLHFRSQPLHPDQHAMRRSKEAGVLFSITIQIYSGALIVLGACYKMFLYDFLYEASPKVRRRALMPLLSGILGRRDLAGDASSGLDNDVRRQRVANFFSGSLALSWLCSDIMILTHRGLKVNIHRCQCKGTRKIKSVAVALILMRVGLVVFIATVSQYDTTPETVSLWGMAGILAQVVLRVIGGFVFPDDSSNEHDNGDENKWPNVTEPQSEPLQWEGGNIAKN